MLRRFRTALIVPAAALALAGCGLATPITTAKPYNASDGVRVVLDDEVRVNNAMVLTRGEGEGALLLGQLVNDSRTDAVDVTITDPEGADVHTASIDPHGTDNLTAEPVALDLPDDAEPGSTIQLTFAAEGSDSVAAEVPVLDGTLEEYAQYLEDAPEPSQTATN